MFHIIAHHSQCYYYYYYYYYCYYYYYYYYYYIDRCIYLNLSESTQSTAWLKALKPAVNGIGAT